MPWIIWIYLDCFSIYWESSSQLDELHHFSEGLKPPTQMRVCRLIKSSKRNLFGGPPGHLFGGVESPTVPTRQAENSNPAAKFSAVPVPAPAAPAPAPAPAEGSTKTVKQPGDEDKDGTPQSRQVNRSTLNETGGAEEQTEDKDMASTSPKRQVNPNSSNETTNGKAPEEEATTGKQTRQGKTSETTKTVGTSQKDATKSTKTSDLQNDKKDTPKAAKISSSEADGPSSAQTEGATEASNATAESKDSKVAGSNGSAADGNPLGCLGALFLFLSRER